MQAGDEPVRANALTVFELGAGVELLASVDTHVVLLGGAPLDGPRYLWWNFVASSEVLLDQTRHAWNEQHFPMVEGDPEFIPLPTDGRVTLLLKAG